MKTLETLRRVIVEEYIVKAKRENKHAPTMAGRRFASVKRDAYSEIVRLINAFINIRDDAQEDTQ